MKSGRPDDWGGGSALLAAEEDVYVVCPGDAGNCCPVYSASRGLSSRKVSEVVGTEEADWFEDGGLRT